MLLKASEICEKEVINTSNGTFLGFAEDILLNVETKKSEAIIIRRKPKFFVIFGREEELIIGWEKIEKVGEDVIFVKTENIGKINEEKTSFFKKFLNIFL